VGRGVSRALAKQFLAVKYKKKIRPTIYLKQKIIIFVTILPERELGLVI
jgi:hypothetical protein